MKNTLLFKSFLTFSFFILHFSLAQAQLSGTYTIDSSKAASATNFQTFTAAADSLNKNGISGPVVFNIADGIYHEQIYLHAIKGSSSTNTIIFQSASGDSSKVTLTDTANSAQNYTVRLDTVSFITFEKITVSQTSVSWGGGSVISLNSPKMCSFLNNKIIGYKSGADVSVAHGGNGNLYKNNLLICGEDVFDNNNYDTGKVQYETNLSFDNNVVESFDSIASSGVVIYNVNEMDISGNTFLSAVTSMDIENCINVVKISKNRIFSTGTGIQLIHCRATANSPTIISNNVISIIYFGWNSNGNGILECGDSNIYALYNTIDIQPAIGYNGWILSSSNWTADVAFYNSYYPTYSARYYGFYFGNYNSGNNILMNNNLVNQATGYSITVDSVEKKDTINYNNLYSNGYVALLDSMNEDSLSDWQKATGLDLNSVSVNPWFAQSDTSVYSVNPALKNGIPIPEVKDDYYGNLRDSITPTIGAFEIHPPQYDASVYSIDSLPVGLCNSNSNVNVYATISNMGINLLTSAVIHWSVNGISQPDTTWTGSLSPGYTSNSFSIGSYLFASNNSYIVKVFTSLPDGKNIVGYRYDTAVQSFTLAMSGTYTIGDTGADFTSFSQAINSLNQYGICGPVVFNVANGVYKEQLSLHSVLGSSNVNTITFQSASGDSNKVIVESDTSSVILRMDNIWYLDFRQMSFKYNGTNYQSSKIYINKGISIRLLNNLYWSVNLDIENSNTINVKNSYIHPNQVGGILIGQANYPYNNGYNNNYGYNSYDTISSNIIESANYGISVVSPSGVMIDRNIINGVRTGVFSNKGIQVTNLNSYSGYGSPVPLGGQIDILNNKITEDSVGSIGIDFEQIYGQYGSASLIANNFISVYNSVGIYSVLDSNVIFTNNNILESGNSGTDFHYLNMPYGSDKMELANNNFVNKTGGVAVFYDRTPSFLSFCNYNNFYVPKDSPVFSSTGGIKCTFKFWQDSFSFDLNSLTVNPLYVNDTDLHATNDSLTGKGTSIPNLKTDIDGHIRPNPPTIGANEIKFVRRTIASFFASDTGCTYAPLSFKNNSISDSCGKINNWLWSFGDGDTSTAQNPTHAYSTAGIFSVKLTVFSSGGCIDSFSKKIFVDSTCVWPGDANNDKIVDTNDVLYIGIAYNNTGPKRADTTTQWYGHFCDNWSNTFHNGANQKHADCNGDGIVDSNDLAAVTLNWGDTHKKTGLTSTGNPNDPSLYLQFSKNSYNPGDSVTANIMLGTSSISNIYGLSSGFAFDHSFVDTTSLKITFGNSWFGSPGKDMVSFVHKDFGNNSLAFAITHIDHKNTSGYGKIGALSFVIPTTAATQKTSSFQPNSGKGISFNESIIPIYLPEDSFSIGVTTGIKSVLNRANDINLYPNPANTNINIESANNYIRSVTIYDATGKEVYSLENLNTQNQSIPVGSLPSGIYIVKLETDNGSYEAKFMKD